LTAMGALQLAGRCPAAAGPRMWCCSSLGCWRRPGWVPPRDATVAVFARDDRSWLRYRPATLTLWAATVAVRVGLTMLAHTVAVSGPALLLSVG